MNSTLMNLNGQMSKRLIALFTMLSVCIFISFEAEAGRIRLRKVKEAPKTCTTMSEDHYLSKPSKKIFGTLRNSLVLEDSVLIVDDLGKKVCQWSYDKWLGFGDLTQYQFFINEQKNELIPYAKVDEGYLVAKVNLESCELGDIESVDQLSLPRCEMSKASKFRKKSKKNRRSTVGQVTSG